MCQVNLEELASRAIELKNQITQLENQFESVRSALTTAMSESDRNQITMEDGQISYRNESFRIKTVVSNEIRSILRRYIDRRPDLEEATNEIFADSLVKAHVIVKVNNPRLPG
ncbi:hypothetical protein K8T06_10795 [bacterium]|nr:hypothetical protein [bacterium]